MTEHNVKKADENDDEQAPSGHSESPEATRALLNQPGGLGGDPEPEDWRPTNRTVEGEHTYWDCPGCNFPICTWTGCPECGWYSDQAWRASVEATGEENA